MSKRLTREEFIERARKVHGDKYDYSKVDYVSIHAKVCIICPKHGEFWQDPSSHLSGVGCSKCGHEKIGKKNSSNSDEFIDKSRKVHGDKYDYSKVEYKNNRTKVCIICPEHGEFWQTPNNHLIGQGCPICSGNVRLTKEEFINRAKGVRGDKYDYSNVEYVNTETKVRIICPKHGEFLQSPHTHLNGNGCPKCGAERMVESPSSNSEEFIQRAKEIHGDKYDYSKVGYENTHKKVCIICPEHGEFWQTPHNHLIGQGCPLCGISKNSLRRKSTPMIFEEKSNIIHNFKYIYHGDYVDSKTKVRIICPIHGDFEQTPNDHLMGHGCPKCTKNYSKTEDEIIDAIKGIYCEKHNKTILGGKEIDIYIPSLKLGIEYNGMLWHSDKFGKDRNYHVDKLNACNKQNVRLIQIFEDEWLNHKEICESKLKQICGLNDKPKIYGRKCVISEISKNDAKWFLNKNHIQGFTGATVYIGVFHNSKLIGVMTFKKEKDIYWDLNRFATDINCQCVGVGGKLFSYFKKNYEFKEIKSFADRRWTADINNNLYIKLGFKLDKVEKPDYRYFCPSIDRHNRLHKFSFRKKTLHDKYGLPLTMTETEMARELGFYRIWDCGLIKYIYKK